MQSFERTVDGKMIDLFPPLSRALDAAKRAAHRIDFGAVIVEAIFHLHVDGPTQRIEPESGIARHHGDRFYRGRRNQIPVYGVAERFVDAHSILINREPLRRAGHRGRDEATKLQVWLEWIAGNFIDNDTRHVFLQGIRDIWRPDALDLSCVNDIDACRHLIDLNPRIRTRYRRRGVHHASWQGPHGARRISGAAGLGVWRGPRNHDGWQGLNGAGRVLGISTFIPTKQAYRYR